MHGGLVEQLRMRVGNSAHISLTEFKGVVNPLITHHMIRGCPDHAARVRRRAAEKITGLQDDRLATLESESERSGDTGEAAAYDDDGDAGIWIHEGTLAEHVAQFPGV